jgi:Ca-activated chloride channel family protein
VPADPGRIADAAGWITRTTGGGGTELLPALERAMALPRRSKDVSRTLVVVTDGYVAGEAAMFQHIRDNLGDANVFSFGIGSAVNRHLTDGIARAGQGEPFVVLDAKHGADAAARFRAYVEAPVLTRVAVGFDGFAAYDVEPKALPDVFANRPVVVFGKYRGAPAGKVTLTGVSGRGRFAKTIDVAAVTPDAKNAALSYLWARAKISELTDFFPGDTNKKQVVELGLTYNLLTKFTSFIAVQQVVRATGGSTDVDQPLPMPAGVSDLAVGVEVGSEPELPVLLGLVALGLLGWRRRARRTRRSSP